MECCLLFSHLPIQKFSVVSEMPKISILSPRWYFSWSSVVHRWRPIWWLFHLHWGTSQSFVIFALDASVHLCKFRISHFLLVCVSDVSISSVLRSQASLYNFFFHFFFLFCLALFFLGLLLRSAVSDLFFNVDWYRNSFPRIMILIKLSSIETWTGLQIAGFHTIFVFVWTLVARVCYRLLIAHFWVTKFFKNVSSFSLQIWKTHYIAVKFFQSV